jgi:hypothetical protein
MAQCRKGHETMIITSIFIFSFVVILVAIDEMLDKNYALGEEWDFTQRS